MPCSAEYVVHDVTGDIGESIVSSGEAPGQAFVIDTKLVQNGGLQVVNVNGLFGDIETEVIGASVYVSSANAASGEPDTERLRMMVASVGLLPATDFAHGSATEFAGHDDKCFIEQTALVEVVYEGGHASIGHFTVPAKSSGEVAVMVPRTVDEMHKADSAFNHASSEQAVGAEGTCGFVVDPVQGVRGG